MIAERTGRDRALGKLPAGKTYIGRSLIFSIWGNPWKGTP